MDEISPTKHISHAFAEVYKKRLRYSDRLGWLVRDGNIWWPDEQQATQICRIFCVGCRPPAARSAIGFRSDRRNCAQIGFV